MKLNVWLKQVGFLYVTLCPAPAALLKLLDVAIPCFVGTVKKDQERQVVMGVLETMNAVVKSCKEHVFKNPKHLQQISYAIRDVLKKKVGVGERPRCVAVRDHLLLELHPVFCFVCVHADRLPGH